MSQRQSRINIKNKIKYGYLKYNKNTIYSIYVRNPSKINLKRKDDKLLIFVLKVSLILNGEPKNEFLTACSLVDHCLAH